MFINIIRKDMVEFFENSRIDQTRLNPLDQFVFLLLGQLTSIKKTSCLENKAMQCNHIYHILHLMGILVSILLK